MLRLALPRATVKDIVYEGKFIPAGTTIYLNAWACNMDPVVWCNPKCPPDSFRPERWLEQPDAPLFTYGLGYRMCAGSLLANRELYLVFMRMLSCFEIQKATEVDTHPVSGSADPASLVTVPRKCKYRSLEMLLCQRTSLINRQMRLFSCRAISRYWTSCCKNGRTTWKRLEWRLVKLSMDYVYPTFLRMQAMDAFRGAVDRS